MGLILTIGKLSYYAAKMRGHFPTLMLFEKGDLVARLDYVITEPNLVWHPEYQF